MKFLNLFVIVLFALMIGGCANMKWPPIEEPAKETTAPQESFVSVPSDRWVGVCAIPAPVPPPVIKKKRPLVWGPKPVAPAPVQQ